MAFQMLFEFCNSIVSSIGSSVNIRQLEALSARNEADTYFKVMGRLRQGMVYDALDQRSVAQDRYRQVLSMKDWGTAHDQAKRYLDRPYGG